MVLEPSPYTGRPCPCVPGATHRASLQIMTRTIMSIKYVLRNECYALRLAYVVLLKQRVHDVARCIYSGPFHNSLRTGSEEPIHI